MKKIKNIWNNNRVLFVLFIVLIICLVAIVTVAMSYFVGSEKSPYGNRLDDKVKFDKKSQENIKNAIMENDSVNDVSIRLAVRTMYINIKYNSGVALDDAKKVAESSIDNIDKKILDYYDINFIILKDNTENDEGFTLMGARNSLGNGLYWNNNTVIVEEEEE